MSITCMLCVRLMSEIAPKAKFMQVQCANH